jgi:hypothetical protein
MDLTFPSPRL